MVELKFDCKETEDYYWKMRKKLGVGRPAKWNNSEKIITKAILTFEDIVNTTKTVVDAYGV